MQAEKAVRGQHPSTSLRTSEKSTTRLSDSTKLMGTLTHQPENPEEGASVSMQLPTDGTGDSLSVRPATKNAVQVFGSLSRVGKKLRDSQEAQATKRTQSQAGIDDGDGDSRSASKRLRTSDPATTRGKSYGYPGGQPAPQAVSQPVAQPAAKPAAQPAVRPAVQPTAQPVVQAALQTVVQPAVQPVPRLNPQPEPQVLAMAPVPALGITPDMQAQIAMAEALRMANSVLPFQPEKISELFQFLCRAQLWPLLKLEEQRALYLMNLQRAMPMPYCAFGIPVTGMGMAFDAPPSSTTTTTTQPVAPTPVMVMEIDAPSSSTTTTTTQPASPPPIPVAGTAATAGKAVVQKAPLSNPNSATRPPASIAQAVLAEPNSNVSKIQEQLLPDPPSPPSLDYARGMLGSLPEGIQRLMKKPAEEIRKMLGWQKLDLETTNNMTAFTCFLVEIVSHGGLPHLNGELDSIVEAFLQRYLTSHRHREPENKHKGPGVEEARKVRIGKDPAYGQLLRLLPKYRQFARQLGIGINNLQPTHRTHLGISRKFNAVLALMKERRFLSDAQFQQRLDKIADDASSPKSSSTAPPASATSSTPTSVRPFQLEGGEDEGSDGEI